MVMAPAGLLGVIGMWCQMGKGGHWVGRGVVAAAVMMGLAGWGPAGPAAAAGSAKAASGAVAVARAVAVTVQDYAGVNSVSCGAAGSCAAGGHDGDGGLLQGLVALERNGRWGRAIAVPGLAALNTGGQAEVNSVSCVRSGHCAAGGYYSDNRGGQQGFVVTEQDGRWGKVIEVPGLAALNKEAFAQVTSVSCGAAGDCLAGGFYSGEQGFVAAEQNGRWGKAIEVPGLAALNTYNYATINSVSCASAGNCAVGGYYSGGGSPQLAFVASERHGAWARAIEVPGLAALNNPGFAEVNSVSCGAAGDCAAGGVYVDRHDRWQGFAVLERNGRWGKATYLPGLPALNKGGRGAFAPVTSVSCSADGDCAAGGYYTDRHHHQQGFVAAEHNGHWARATAVPGLVALNKGRSAQVDSVSCTPVGYCVAAGYYASGPFRPKIRFPRQQAFTATEQNGRWGPAAQIPGLAALNTYNYATINSVSCPSARNCAVGGSYANGPGYPGDGLSQQGFAAAEHNGIWNQPTQMPS